MAQEKNKDTNRGGLRSRLPKFLTEPINLPGTTSEANSEAGAVAPADSAVGAEDVSNEELSPEELQFQYLDYLVSEIQQMRGEMQRMQHLVEEVSERESAQEKIFNTLHMELRDYKNDFIYEHLKPIVRPLLFLYDSLEQFDVEIALYERPQSNERRQGGLSPKVVRENIAYFRDQLVEALRICEVTPMETPRGVFNPRMHKVIDVVPVDEKQDGSIQRVVRSGWYLNGQLLRSAEVIVGKKMA